VEFIAEWLIVQGKPSALFCKVHSAVNPNQGGGEKAGIPYARKNSGFPGGSRDFFGG
jgi:hypothetical protein